MNNKNKKNKKKQFNKLFTSPFDPLGSYTGKYLIGEIDEPEQDVDDL